MKKWMAVALCLVLALFFSTNSTFASEFNLGNIFQIFSGNAPTRDVDQLDVELVYHARQGGTLVRTTQNPVLSPAYYADSASWQTVPVNVGGVSYPLWDESGIVGIVDRFVAVTNVASSPACVRVAFAVDANMLPLLKINFNTDPTLIYTDWRDITIDGAAFKMLVVTYTGSLAQRETTPPILLQLAMDKDVTSDDLSGVSSNFLQIQALAIEDGAFTTQVDGQNVALSPVEALDLAIPVSSGFNPFQ